VLEGDEYPILRLNDASWEIMKGHRSVSLGQPVVRNEWQGSRADTASWERSGPRSIRGAPTGTRPAGAGAPSAPLPDFQRCDLARAGPHSPVEFTENATWFTASERSSCAIRRDNLAIDSSNIAASQFINGRLAQACPVRPCASDVHRPNPSRDLAFNLYRQGTGIEDVMHQTGRGRSNRRGLFVRVHPAAARCHHLNLACGRRLSKDRASLQKQVGIERLKPIFIALEEKMSYDEIRIAVAYLSSSGGNQLEVANCDLKYSVSFQTHERIPKSL